MKGVGDQASSLERLEHSWTALGRDLSIAEYGFRDVSGETNPPLPIQPLSLCGEIRQTEETKRQQIEALGNGTSRFLVRQEKNLEDW